MPQREAIGGLKEKLGILMPTPGSEDCYGDAYRKVCHGKKGPLQKCACFEPLRLPGVGC